MPIKFQKDVSTHLFKYLRQIDISFNREFRRSEWTTTTRQLCTAAEAEAQLYFHSFLQFCAETHTQPLINEHGLPESCCDKSKPIAFNEPIPI
jgi:hypothetical protein